MKLSDYVAEFIHKQGVKHVFVVTGGAVTHIIDSLAKHPKVKYICTQHEQGAAMSADAYSRVTGNLGVAIATSGPGATNLITGVCCAYYDSIPVLYITGQVSTFRLKKNIGVRQLGFQETDTTEIYKPITKYTVLIEDAKKIKYELEKSVYIAKSGRPGPVLIDIPDNIQRENIEPNELESFVYPIENTSIVHYEKITDCLSLIKNANRPIIIIGWGVSLGKAQEEAIEFIEKTGIPVLFTWAMMYLLPFTHKQNIGSFGIHGTRYGNFAVQNSDLIISLGSRLDTHLTGSPITSFARGAKKIIVDIDVSELNKYKLFGMQVDVLINSDVKYFLQNINTKIYCSEFNDISEWKKIITKWKEKYSICPIDNYAQKDINPYVFVKTLSNELSEGELIFVDTGCAIGWMMQAFEFKRNQRLFHDFNNTSMGYALPASIGACFALNKQQVICVIGDGSLQMTIQELATISGNNLPIKIFLINNRGYSMIKQTQDQWLDSKYYASSIECGLNFPDFEKIANAYNLKSVSIKYNNELSTKIRDVIDYDGSVLCIVNINPEHRIIPQTKYGRPIEDSEPLLDRKELLDNMIVA